MSRYKMLFFKFLHHRFLEETICECAEVAEEPAVMLYTSHNNASRV